jgi:hypothetical protein
MTGIQRSTFQALTVAAISLGPIVLLGGCRESQTKQVASVPNPAATAQSSAVLTPPPAGILPVPNQPLLQNSQLPTIPIRGLTPATEPQSLATKAQTQNSKIDPFAITAPSIISIPVSQPATDQATKAQATKGQASKGQGTKAKTIARTATKNPPIAKAQPIARAATQYRANRPAIGIPSFPQTRYIEPITPLQMPTTAIVPPAAPRVAAVPATSTQNFAPITAPQPSLAEAIAITGVLQTNGNTTIIAKSPNESSARYVKAGDSIGSVRVKSINVSRSGEPIVVLEQNGVEVTKSIGPGR